MNKKGFVSQEEDKLIESRVNDSFLKASDFKEKFLGFLDPHERVIAERKAKTFSNVNNFENLSFGFYGGYPDAERVFLGVFVPYSEVDLKEFPIKAIKISWRFKTLTHRDFLGAILSLGIVKSKIGDIIVLENEATVLVEKTVAEFILENLKMVGSCGVSCEEIDGNEIKKTTNFQEIKTTIASVRLDCVVSALINSSRSNANELILGGLVSVDHEVCTNNSLIVFENSTVSIRGHGRFAVLKLGPKTKKGRLSFTANKYI